MKRLLTVTLLCLFALLPAKAQNTLTGLNEVGGTPLNKSISGDFNGDGLTDFVFISGAQLGQIELTTYLGRGGRLYQRYQELFPAPQSLMGCSHLFPWNWNVGR